MVSVQLDSAREHRLRASAAAQGQEVAELARHILENYLDALDWTAEPPEQWGEASISLAGEVFPNEKWEDDEDRHESR